MPDCGRYELAGRLRQLEAASEADLGAASILGDGATAAAPQRRA